MKNKRDKNYKGLLTNKTIIYDINENVTLNIVIRYYYSKKYTTVQYTIQMLQASLSLGRLYFDSFSELLQAFFA